MFTLDPRLEQDCLTLGDLPLCRLLLSKDANYPWFILVPRREGISELFHLDEADQRQFWSETSCLAQWLCQAFGADKMNVATLGNVVSQMHMHVVVRRKDDAAWPAPIWGRVPAIAYTDGQLEAVRQRFHDELPAQLRFQEA